MSATNENSLAPWIGNVPPHWKIRRLGFVADVILSNVDKHTLDGELPVRLCNYTDVYKNDRITSAIEFMQASALPREIEKFHVRKGDVLVTKDSEDPNDIAVSALIAEDLPGVLCGYHLAMLRPDQRQICGPFLAWVQTSKQIRAQYEAQATGVTRFALGQSNFKEVVVPLPPVPEQRRIAAYLDEQTAKIDRLIDMRRRQMALLKEQRAALIQQAVTRGLNHNAPMKDSGLPWLGEVPAHWEVKRGRFLVRSGRNSVKPGPFGTQLKTSDYVETGIKVFNQESVISGDFQRGNNFITPQKFSELTEFETGPGDVLLTTRGTIGRCGIVRSDEVKAIIHPCLMRVRFNQQVITNEYAVAFIEKTKLFLEQVNLLSNETTIEVIYSENFREVVFPVPPLEEQREILAFIEEGHTKTDNLHAAYTRQLELLTEYRAALIHECVTGVVAVGADNGIMPRPTCAATSVDNGILPRSTRAATIDNGILLPRSTRAATGAATDANTDAAQA